MRNYGESDETAIYCVNDGNRRFRPDHASRPCQAKKAATTPAKTAAPAKKAEPTPDRPPGLYWIINTSMGTITAQLYEKEAPGTVANFVALTRGTKAAKDKSGAMTKRPYFNNLTFHRVIPGFMIQTGDGQQGDGTGDCGFTIKDEIVPTLKYDKPGMLGLARLTQRNTGACQFFITGHGLPFAEWRVHHLRPGGGWTGRGRQDRACRQGRQR